MGEFDQVEHVYKIREIRKAFLYNSQYLQGRKIHQKRNYTPNMLIVLHYQRGKKKKKKALLKDDILLISKRRPIV